MRRKEFVFVVTHGRSGSTLLNGVLNSIPGYRIMGENNNAVYQLYLFDRHMTQAYENSVYNQMQNHLIGPRNMWWNDYSQSQLSIDLRDVLCHLFDPYDDHDVTGFKEIRWYAIPDLPQYLHWLHDVTGCRFIHLTRNLDDVLQSEWFQDDPGNWRRTLTGFNHLVTRNMEMHPEQPWYSLSYEEMTQGHLQGLYRFLGVKYDEQRIRDVLALPHGYKSNGPVRTTTLR